MVLVTSSVYYLVLILTFVFLCLAFCIFASLSLSPCVTLHPSILLFLSQNKEFSYSEMDLRKPKRMATFSFGLRKKKTKDEENISKSTLALRSPGTIERNEVKSLPERCFLKCIAGLSICFPQRYAQDDL